MSTPDYDRIAEAISPEQLARAVGAQKSGSGWQCPFPDHDDNSPSFSVWRDKGRTLGKCHGCDRVGSPVAIAAEVWGMSEPDAAERLVREIGLNVASDNGRPEIVATYDYVDEDGELLIQAVRLFPKSFRQRRPDGRGGWDWSLGDTRRVLYRLPEVIEAVALEKTIYVVEGEKDVHALEEAGAVATTCPMGAGKWRDEYSEVLRGAHVRIIADQDVAGSKHALTVAASLAGVAESVELLQAAKGKDAADHLSAGHGLEDFQPFESVEGDEAESTRVDPLTPPEPPEELPVPVRALGAEVPPPPEFRVRGWALEAEIGLLVGQGGDFKTTSAVLFGGAVAGGYPLFGSRVFQAKQGRVLIVSNEDGLGVLLNRLEALVVGHGWDREAVLGNVYFLALEGVDLDSARWRDHISAQVDALGIDVLIFDPYAELTTRPENENDATKELVRYWRGLNRKGVTVLIVHHAGKRSEGKSKLDRIRGASALNAAARFVHFFEGTDLGFSVECLKMSRGERPKKFVVRAEIEADPENRASWTRARLSYMSEHRAQDHVAERFVLGQLTGEPGPTSTELRALASSAGINPREAAEALKSLQDAGRVAFKPGPRNARNWYRLDPASQSQKTAENDPACPGDAGSGDPAYAGNAGSAELPCDPAPLFRGGAGSGGSLSGPRVLHRMCASCGTAVGATAELCAECKYGEVPA